MGLKDRLLLITKELKLTGRAFEKECNLTKGAFAGFGDGVGADNLRKIFIRYPQFSANWLLTGEGEMLIQPSKTIEPMPEIFEKILLRKDDDIKEQASRINELIKVNTRLEIENEQLKKMFATSENFANISSTKKNQISENL